MKNPFKIDIPDNRIFGLDLLRFLAISFVVIGHGIRYFPDNISEYFSFLIFDGVTIFFVLSGFLIGGILIKILNKNRFTFKVLLNFWERRWFRTLPNYLLILSILLILNILFIPDFNISEKYKYYLFVQNFKTPQPNFFPESWSLSIEEWFYLLTPLMLFILINVLKIKVNQSIIFTICFFIIFITVFRSYRFYFNIRAEDISIWDSAFRKQVITRLDSLMYGFLAAYIFYYHKCFWLKYRLPFLIFGISLLLIERFYWSTSILPYSFQSIISFSIISAGTMFLLPFLNSYTVKRSKISNCITIMSIISYSLYLIHLSIIQSWMIDKFEIFKEINNQLHFSNFIIYLFLSVVLSFLLYKYFEVPTTKLRDRIKYPANN